MARHPEVLVGPLPVKNGRKPARISRTARNPVQSRQAVVAPMSDQDLTVRLSELRAHLLDRGTVVAISRESLRRISGAGGVSRLTTTTTW